jgi:hypothetical protein
MKYQKAPSEAQIETLLQLLRIAMKNGNDFFVMADLETAALNAGSGKMDLLEFMVSCMLANGETAELLVNVVMNFLSNKILQDVCGNCNKSDSCQKKEANCDPEHLFADIKTQVEMALKLTKIGKN